MQLQISQSRARLHHLWEQSLEKIEDINSLFFIYVLSLESELAQALDEWQLEMYTEGLDTVNSINRKKPDIKIHHYARLWSKRCSSVG